MNTAFVFPGMTASIEIVQLGRFPLGCPHFFILTFGTGTLGISLKNESSATEIIFMTGKVLSQNGTETIARLGYSEGIIEQIVEISSGDAPFSLVWLYCGVAYADTDPAYLYDLRLSLTP